MRWMNNCRTYEQELEAQGCLIYTTTGRSMRPFIRSKEDLVRIQARGPERCRKYDAVLYKRPGGKYVLHRIVKVRQADYVLCGDNFWQLEPGVRDEQILGVLTHVIRNGEEIDVNTPGYRSKVKLWYALYPPRAMFLYLRGKLRAILRKLRGKNLP